MELPAELSEKGQVNFYVTSGTIITQSNYKTTQVWSNNRVLPDGYGGGVVVQNINSRDVAHADFWLLLENGKEIHISLSELEAYAREGHRVSLIGAQHNEKYYWVGFVNHTTDRYSWIAYDVLLSPSVVVPMLWFLFVLWGISSRYSLGIAVMSAAVSSFLVTWPYRAIAKSVKRSSMTNHIKKIAEWILANSDNLLGTEQPTVVGDTTTVPSLVSPAMPAETMFCAECGTQLAIGDSFCNSCGMRVALE